MTGHTKEQIDNLMAAEYVLGTLDGKGREKIKKELIYSEKARQLITLWEQQLNQLGEQIKPVKPSAQLFEKIAERLGHKKAAKSTSSISRFFFNPILAYSFSVLFAVMYFQAPLSMVTEPTAFNATQAAVFQDQELPVVLVEVGDEFMHVRATKALPQLTNQDYELWMVDANGTPPISLGTIPFSGKLMLKKDVLFDKLNIGTLAISIEIQGGSITGSPGEVKYLSQLTEI